MIEMYADKKPDPKQARCYDCLYLKGAVTLWCTNEKAVKYRGTRIADIRECFRFWEPMKMRPTKIGLFKRLSLFFGRGDIVD